MLQLFIKVLMRLTTRYALQSRTDSETEALEAVDHLHTHHSRIVAAVTAGDPARAKTLSERHVEAVTAWLQRHHAGDRNRGRTPRRPLNSEVPQGKLAEMLAATIGDDIAADGWRVGSVFGTETALLQRYRVSRAVFREAVRLLEYHSIAHMRRGPGGGLVIAEPAAQASIDTIALYLQYRDPSREDLRCVRDAIEIDNVAKVVKRLAEPQVAAFVASRRSGLPDDSRQTPTTCGGRSPRSSTSTSGWHNSPATPRWICSCGSSSSCSAGTGRAPDRRYRPGRTCAPCTTRTCGSPTRSRPAT